MRKLFDLQLFADDAPATGADAGTGENVQKNGAPADQGKATTEPKNDDQKPKYTEKDVDDIVGKKFAKWQAQQQKAVDEAKKLAAMNAQQKAEYERDQLQKELDALKKQASIAEMMKTARKMLSDNDVTVSDELLAMFVSDNAEKTKTAIDGFLKMYKEDVAAAIKKLTKGEPPRRGAGGTASMTKEQIMAIRDPELRQKKMLENKHLFNF